MRPRLDVESADVVRFFMGSRRCRAVCAPSGGETGRFARGMDFTFMLNGAALRLNFAKVKSPRRDRDGRVTAFFHLRARSHRTDFAA